MKKSKFVSDKWDFNEPPCNSCIHYYHNATCKAFPNGIPRIILRNERKHRKPLKEQSNDIVYKKRK